MRRAFILTAGFLFLVPAGLATGGAPPSAWTETGHYQFEYRVRIQDKTPGPISIWIPYPAESEAQRVLEAHVEAPLPYRITSDKKFGNRMAYLHGEGPWDGEIVLRFLVERDPFRGVPPDAAAPGTPLDPALYLGADRLIPLQGKIRRLSAEQAKGRQSPGEKARAIYDFVYRTMTYKKEGTGWGRGDAVWACDSHYGNCTDFHSLFIGMARSASVPARFLIGFPIPMDAEEGTVPGYHCWAEFFDPERGWVGLDASEAWKNRQPEDYFGRLPNNRIEFTVGRDLVLEPPQQGEPLNYFIYPYVEVGGKELKGFTTEFHFKKLKPRSPAAS
ncbi:MAG: transglutaminase [Acidobacteria bacterium]|nr:MAG: transglutaminase [Acidobacteriota bacterium]